MVTVTAPVEARVASPDIETGARTVLDDATRNCPAVGAVDEPVPPFAIDSGTVAVARAEKAVPLVFVTVIVYELVPARARVPSPLRVSTSGTLVVE